MEEVHRCNGQRTAYTRERPPYKGSTGRKNEREGKLTGGTKQEDDDRDPSELHPDARRNCRRDLGSCCNERGSPDVAEHVGDGSCVEEGEETAAVISLRSPENSTREREREISGSASWRQQRWRRGDRQEPGRSRACVGGQQHVGAKGTAVLRFLVRGTREEEEELGQLGFEFGQMGFSIYPVICCFSYKNQ